MALSFSSLARLAIVGATVAALLVTAGCAAPNNGEQGGELSDSVTVTGGSHNETTTHVTLSDTVTSLERGWMRRGSPATTDSPNSLIKVVPHLTHKWCNIWDSTCSPAKLLAR